MRNFKPRRPSPAMVVAMVALFVAMSGSGYAAVTLSKNSVKAKHIAANAVGASEIKSNAVAGSEVKDGSLGVAEFKASDRAALRGPAGANGAQGPQGTQGIQGVQGPPGPGTAANIFFATNDTTVTNQEILNLGGLILRANCSASTLTVSATSTVNNALVHSAVQTFQNQYVNLETVTGGGGGTIQDNYGGDEYRESDDLDVGETAVIIDTSADGGGGDSQAGTLTYVRPDGQVVTVTWTSERTDFDDPNKACMFAGTAVDPQ